jgi:hypothetical protein
MTASKSLLSNQFTCAQVYATDFGWIKVNPMNSKGEAPSTLDFLDKQYGAFCEMIPDNAKELTLDAFKQKLRISGTIIKPIEAYWSNQNRAENAIHE